MNNHDEEVESALLGFCPVGPAPGLRSRVLSQPLRFPKLCWLTAALWLVTCTLWFEASRLDQRTAELLAHHPVLTGQANEAVSLLGGDPPARRYVMAALSNHGPIYESRGDMP